MKEKLGTRVYWIIALAMVVGLALPWIALADNISNNLDTTIDAVAEVMALNVGGANGSTQLYVDPTNGDGKNGCNLTGQTTLVVSVSSSNTSVATVSPASVSFTSCGDKPTLTVTPVSQGSATISLALTSNSTGGSFDLAPATFTVNVTAPPPANTAPTVNISGVTGGASYEIGAVPTATCEVTDTEDGNSSFPATLSTVTGPLATYGLGAQTASCSYTDAGGLTASASVTYGIVDTTAPVITFVSRTEANANGWNNGDVTVEWSCTDSGSGVVADSVSQTVSLEGAGQSATGTCEDHAGNTASDTQTGINIDKTAPSASASASPAPNANGWNNTDVTVSFSGEDALSGIDFCSDAVVLSAEGAGQSATGSCTDKAGNVSLPAIASGINIDTTAPAITFLSRTPANSNGWNNSDVIVTWSCTDSGSGVVAATVSATVNTEGENQSATGTCEDRAGNTASDTQTDINIDLTAPTASASASPAANGLGWNNTDVTVSFSGTDGLSGIASCSAAVVLSDEGADQSASGTCTDKAGNSGTATASGINIDKTAPVATASASPAANANGWNNSDVTVSFTGDDSLSGIASCSADVVLKTEGANQSASGSCTDKAGNVSALATASGINIDKTAPTASASASPKPNSNGWNNTNVTVSFSGTDDLSGIASCSGAVVLSAEEAGQSASGTCTDKAGNVSDPVTAGGISIDKTAPTVSLVGGPADGGTYYYGFVPAAPTCSASDTLSGVDGSCSVSGYSSALGSHTVTASATDKAGNSASASATYTVLAWTLKGFYQPVDMGTAMVKVFNVVKGGSTVPLKFEVFAGPTELTETSAVKSFVQTKVACDGTSPVDDIEFTTTGGTTLRYDTTGGQFIQNWQTPKTPGVCYKVTMTTQDLSFLVAYFKLK